MEKKGTIISLVFVGVVVLSAIAFIIFSGITAQDLNYVQLEINPRVEFLCDKHFKVVSCRPLNDDARVVLANVNYKGKDISDVSTDFIDLCAKTGYIDVDGEDNAINITVIDGITQALDVHIVQSVNKYLKQKEILCAVTENYEDRNMFDEKKKNNICCANKFKLMQTLHQSLPEYSLKQLGKLSEVKLINLTNNYHIENKFSPTKSETELKEKLTNLNSEKYSNHMKKITNESQSSFATKYEKFQKAKAKIYSTNFQKEYTSWQDKQLS